MTTTELEHEVFVTHTKQTLDVAFRDDVLAGLSASRKTIPARWLYDHRGSELFEDITTLPEYYPTRTERTILASQAQEIAQYTGSGRVVAEFGSGSSLKTPLLLRAINPAAYVPIDISGDFLAESVATLSQEFDALPMYPVVGDFMQPLALPRFPGAKYLGFFPGSTIGNMVAPLAVDLLRAMGKSLGAGAQLLIGIDRIKSTDILLPAYDDAAGVTAEFNLNVLHRINRELGARVPVEAFAHEVRWNDAEARIEMHLRARRDVSFTVCGMPFQMRAGETIHTENSIKYGQRDARLLLKAGGWTPTREWTDEQGLFALILADLTPQRPGP